MEEKKKRITRCRYSLPHCIGGSIEYHCAADGWEDDKVRVCTEEECEQCIRFNSRYIEYPIFVNKIENRPIKAHSMGHHIGSLVAVRPCGEEYGDKTYLGIYLGELPIQILTSYDPHIGVLKKELNPWVCNVITPGYLGIWRKIMESSCQESPNGTYRKE